MSESVHHEAKAAPRKALEVSALRADVRQRNLPLRMFYDETNNIRRLKLTDGAVNVPDLRPFVIGGVCHLADTALPNADELRRLLGLQPSTSELKLKHLGKGDFPSLLGSTRLGAYLTMLLDRGLLVHFSVTDPLYWSLVDIVDSILVDKRIGVSELHTVIKTGLYDAAMKSIDDFLILLNRYSYPDIPHEDVSDFLQALSSLVEHHVPYDHDPGTMLIKRLLRQAARLPNVDLPFLSGNRPGTLIDGFSDFFLSRAYTFSHAQHVFDCEPEVERALDGVRLLDGEHEINYRFADSGGEVGIQLSDVFAGLVGHLFSYSKARTQRELKMEKTAFSVTQRRNLDIIKQLIDGSDEVSDGLFHCVLPISEQIKYVGLVHGE
jgi:hypothetical protein